MASIKRELRRTIDAVRSGGLERGRAAVALQGYNVLLRAVEVERRVTENDLAERIFALENTLTELAESEARWRGA